MSSIDESKTFRPVKDNVEIALRKFHKLFFLFADIMESDDVRMVCDEMDKAHNYRKKVQRKSYIIKQ